MDIGMYVNNNLESPLIGSLSITDNINDRSQASFIIDTNNAIEVGHEVFIYGRYFELYDEEYDQIKQLLSNGLNSYTTVLGESITLTTGVSQLTSNSTSKVMLQSDASNVNDIYVGNSYYVSDTNHMFVLSPESQAEFEINNSNLIYVKGTAGEKINLTYLYNNTVIVPDTVKIFAGSIVSHKRISPRGTSLKRYDIKCSDYNELCDRRLVAASYTGQTVTYVVNDIIDTILADEGVTAGTINGDAYTFVNVVFNYKTVAECLNQIKDNTGLNWNIDYDKKLNLFYRNDIVGEPFTNLLANYIDMEVENDKESYRNVQYLRAGYDKTPTITKEKVAPKPDGISRKFRLRFPIAEVPTIYVNDVAISNSDMGINGIQDDKKWYWSKGEKDIIQDDSETVLSDSDTLTVTYKGLRRIIVKSENVQQQNERAGNGLGSGVYEDIDIAAMINDKNTAMDFAKGLLNKYADIPQKVQILTKEFRKAGQIIQITSPKLGIDGEYLIESVDISEESGEFFYDIKALSGEALGSWTEYFRKLKGKYNEYIETENEYLIVALDPQEAINIDGSVEFEFTNALYPAVNLYPSDSLYPNTAILDTEEVTE